jgi:uncharacterized membrane protein
MVAAGVNHFVNPEFYLRLIPPYLPSAGVLNALAGVAEIVGGVGLLLPRTRRVAAWGLIAMLVAFLPVHLEPMRVGECVTPQGPCLPMWAWWVRLVVVHPLLFAWVWWVGLEGSTSRRLRGGPPPRASA